MEEIPPAPGETPDRGVLPPAQQVSRWAPVFSAVGFMATGQRLVGVMVLGHLASHLRSLVQCAFATAFTFTF